MNMIDAGDARKLSEQANFGVKEIIRGIDATVRLRAKSGYSDAECSFSQEIVSEEEITTAIAEIQALSYEIKFKDNGHGFYTLNISW